VDAAAAFGTEFVGPPATHGPLQAQFAPQAADVLEVHRPAFAAQSGVDESVAPARVLAGQPPNGPDQRQVVRTVGGLVAEGGTGTAEGLAGPPLADLVSLLKVSGTGPLLGRRHHFFLAMSWSILLSSISSATSSLRRATSDWGGLTWAGSSRVGATT